MSNLTTFFGGGGSGGSSVAQAPNIYNNFEKNVTPLQANTLTGFTASGRGVNPNIVPCGDDKFFLFEGNSTSKVYASFWSVDGESGVVTQLAAPSQVASDCDEVAAVAANGINRAMLLGGANYNKLYHIYYDSSAGTITNSQLQTNNSNVVQNMCHVTCLTDGTLLGSIGDTSGSRQECYVSALFTDGTNHNSTQTNNIVGGNGYGRMMGTGQGLYFFGPHYNSNQFRVSGKIRIGLNRQASQTAHGNPINQNYYGGGLSQPPIMIPTTGGIMVMDQDNSYYQYKWSMNERDGRAICYEAKMPTSSASVANNNALEGYQPNGTSFCRQADGQYLAFGSGSNTASTVTFADGVHSGYKQPFLDLKPISTYTSGGTNPMGGVLLRNNIILRAWWDDGTQVFVDAYKYNG